MLVAVLGIACAARCDGRPIIDGNGVPGLALPYPDGGRGGAGAGGGTGGGVGGGAGRDAGVDVAAAGRISAETDFVVVSSDRMDEMTFDGRVVASRLPIGPMPSDVVRG